MKHGFYLLIAVIVLPLLGSLDAGEIVTKTYYNSKGEPVKGYVYSAEKTRRTYERRSNRNYRHYGYGYGGYGYPVRYYSSHRYGHRYYGSGRHGGGHRVGLGHSSLSGGHGGGHGGGHHR